MDCTVCILYHLILFVFFLFVMNLIWMNCNGWLCVVVCSRYTVHVLFLIFFKILFLQLFWGVECTRRVEEGMGGGVEVIIPSPPHHHLLFQNVPVFVHNMNISVLNHEWQWSSSLPACSRICACVHIVHTSLPSGCSVWCIQSPKNCVYVSMEDLINLFM